VARIRRSGDDARSRLRPAWMHLCDGQRATPKGPGPQSGAGLGRTDHGVYGRRRAQAARDRTRPHRPLGSCGSGRRGALGHERPDVFIEGPAFGNTQLYLRSVTSSTGAGSTTGPLVTGLTDQHRHPTWSPDRTKVAFAEGPGGATGYDIYILDLTTPNATPQNITNTSGTTEDRPAWSPDGTRIAYEKGNDIIVHP